MSTPQASSFSDEANSLNLWMACEEHGDIYYRLMKEWVQLKQCPETLKKCVAAAHDYRSALDCFITHCEENESRNLRTAIEYRLLLKRSIELLGSANIGAHSPAPPNFVKLNARY